MARTENWHGRKRIYQTKEERKARMNYIRTKEFVVGGQFEESKDSVEKVRDMAKDVYRLNTEQSQIQDKDVYIRAILGSETLIHRLYSYAKARKGLLKQDSFVAKQMLNELQFYDWLQNKLNDIYIAEYRANVSRFGDAQDLEKPKIHRGKRTKEEQLAIDKWNWLHPDDPIVNQYEKRYKKQK